MNNINYLEENILQVRVFIKNTEQRIAAGEQWLDAQLASLKYHLSDLCNQLAEATKTEVNGNAELTHFQPQSRDFAVTY